jgi:hypothetical protein
VSADDLLCAPRHNGHFRCATDRGYWTSADSDDPPDAQEARILAAEARTADELEAVVRECGEAGR